MTNIILCGGSGTRLWPISRTLMPKQFVKLFNDKSLFQLTVERNAKACDHQFIVSNAEQYFLALDQLEEPGIHSTFNIQHSTFLLEPVGRNTAPAIALACLNIDAEEIVLVTPSDHLIKNETAYLEAVSTAKLAAEEGNLVTFGIEPTYPETGFGYIEAKSRDSEKLEVGSGKFSVLDVRKFHEKPNAETAQKYLDAGNYYWNSGMFCFKAGLFLDELKKYAPEIYEACLEAYENEQEITQGQLRIRHEDMMAIPDESIDYAVMEKSDKVKVIPCDIGWSDLGSFDALYDELEKDENGNTLNDNHISLDSKNNLVIADDRTIATIDVEGLMIVDTGDALLVSKKGSSQKVKEVVKHLKEKGSELPKIHLTAHRPWGTYTVLEDTPGYKIKRIVVKPGKRLSLQKHYHRNEHWIVVSGTATVTVGNETKLIRPNESTYIKMGEVHRLANEGKIPVVLIEAQVGEYTGEDDIVRLDDDFKRN
ncbi:mannose-1-phosphate guanylyltransferase/mannose-6-phosphate isomerase [Hydrogenimonas cancrithermarum]|uniref:mannose-1-phosphate guanylyltransferase n=1 Tax=Hydrogenimonas cancrithermarum TaxID=2993563 RepID=A0ABM8FNH2_9BACT|nr:mannose-1-phosphate guanylyltransferase/mannose-6-phosphate isomerase [Hydrogenimonas cancrithermarum]BDY13409.1 mannose-1-phosphate guanylyltransferase/mannose-6-phosphate isomerase [Hydrogenimonas cancrithermarum]